TPSAQALELELKEFYDLNRPASLDYDPTFCGLWIANEGPEVVLVTLDGLELRRFRSDMRRVKAIGLDGNDLLLADGFGNYQRMTKDGSPKGAPFRPPDYMDTEGVVTREDGTIIMVEDDPARLMWLSPSGDILREINTNLLEPALIEPQGIAIDPRNGHLLIVDDWEGTNSLFELTSEGEVLSTTPLIQYGSDPEGIALRPGTNTLFMAFDSGARIAAFDYIPTGGLPLEEPDADCMMF
ncbi:MAG: hypothetical protein AAGP08_17365, partial [Pseudomonadota bacterium]